MASVAPADTNWRDGMTREDRIKVCRHIMQKLTTYYHMVPERALREKTSAFESVVYSHSESRADYLSRITDGLSNIESQVIGNPVIHPNNAGTSVSNGGTENIEGSITVTAAEIQIDVAFLLTATITPADTNWRDAITREDRIKVCQYIMQKLTTYYHMVPEQALREKTSSFESAAYSYSESRADYLRRIVKGLSYVERLVMANTVIHSNNVGTSGSNGGTENNEGSFTVTSAQAEIDVAFHLRNLRI